MSQSNEATIAETDPYTANLFWLKPDQAGEGDRLALSRVPVGIAGVTD